MTVWSSALRERLCARALQYALDTGVDSYRSVGKAGVVLFPPAPNGTAHGNFHPASYAAIAANQDWAARLRKPHTRRATALPRPHDTSAREMDSCTSSDALRMNVMCYPGVVTGGIAALLGVPPGTLPIFGVAGAVPLRDGRVDTTEVDMQIGNTNVEAKLTETSFTSKRVALVERYANLYDVFDGALLPREVTSSGEVEYFSYQLMRNVLAIARRPDARFIVLLDGRRPDLLREWWMIYGAIRSEVLRARCGFVFWQEMALAAPEPLRRFLSIKYDL